MEHSAGAEAFQGDDGHVTTVADSEARPRDLAAVGAALVTVVLWASAFVGIRSAGKTFGPGALSLGRLLVATAALGTVMVARRHPGRLAATTYLVPPISVLLGWLILSETPASLVDLGGALCLVGVGLTRRR
jgi:drug/metabolite transporter (DMT)-like permease